MGKTPHLEFLDLSRLKRKNSAETIPEDNSAPIDKMMVYSSRRRRLGHCSTVPLDALQPVQFREGTGVPFYPVFHNRAKKCIEQETLPICAVSFLSSPSHVHLPERNGLKSVEIALGQLYNMRIQKI